MKTCPKKKQDPNIPSLNVNDDTLYSITWNKVNTPAKTIVKNDPIKAPFLFSLINEWWAYVIVAPLDNNITVFNKGSSNGFIASIPIGGHSPPSSIPGFNELWKNAQKIAIKNKASDTINNKTPIFIPFCTALVWFPKKVPSDIISLNHKDIDHIINITLIYSNIYTLENICIDNTALLVTFNRQKLVYKGQGDGKLNGKDALEIFVKYFYLYSYFNLIYVYTTLKGGLI